ncbi:hypothetical protein QJS04_geneDACA014172 [Acorus gramineus]|uniref:GUN4-like domain-containing protein n=1 Tax=Acorus gramineus TaxID=55184 RepID=A0AAV9B0X3_ACOGR|nr:hypothetical protein QJS04_geneDACA014172 [Acorus gramineus]
MATSSLHHRHHLFKPNHHLFSDPTTPTTTLSTTPLHKPTFPKLSSTTSTTNPTTLDLLTTHLSTQNFRLADEETRRLLIALSGDAAISRGYVFFSEVQFIPADDLRSIDGLWGEFSEGRFGYSIQKRVWEKSGRDFTRFFRKVGWMKRLESEVEQYNYRAFPEEFMWELKEETPMGHLPLTNALRGTQLLVSIFTHPAFEEVVGVTDEVEVEAEEVGGGEMKKSGLKGIGFKRALSEPDYSF